MHTEPVEGPPVSPGRWASRVLRGLMLRDIALLLVNRPKKNISRECALKRHAAQNALNIVWWPGFARTRCGSLQRSQTP